MSIKTYLCFKKKKKRQIEIFIADKAGMDRLWNRRDSRGRICFDTKRRYNRKGNYNLNVERAMRYGPLEKIENLKNVLAIGLIISENNE